MSSYVALFEMVDPEASDEGSVDTPAAIATVISSPESRDIDELRRFAAALDDPADNLILFTQT